MDSKILILIAIGFVLFYLGAEYYYGACQSSSTNKKIEKTNGKKRADELENELATLKTQCTCEALKCAVPSPLTTTAPSITEATPSRATTETGVEQALAMAQGDEEPVAY
jgi:hypothetical protein